MTLPRKMTAAEASVGDIYRALGEVTRGVLGHQMLFGCHAYVFTDPTTGMPSWTCNPNPGCPRMKHVEGDKGNTCE